MRVFRRGKESNMRSPDEISDYFGLLNDEYKESKDFRTLIKIRELAQFMRLSKDKKKETENRLNTLNKLYKVDRDFRTRIKIHVCNYILGIES